MGVGLAALTLGAAAYASSGDASGGEASQNTGHGVIRPVATVSAATSATASSGSGQSRAEQAAAFTACVREHGVADFPGVTITDDGQVHLNLSGGTVNVFSKTYQNAVAACQHLLPQGTKVPTDPSPAAPSVPDLGFSCTGTCPKAPQAPQPPN